MKTLLTLMLALPLAPLPQDPPAVPAETITYRIDQVKRNVTILPAGSRNGAKAAAGSTAHSGDSISTGWFSYALVASDRHNARFELYSSTEVQLTAGTPGVILSLQRGRLHAIFDKVTGNEPRVVQTPGALLAVRGTEYTVDVDDEGKTTVDVWEGAVEVRSPLRPDPFMVRPGESIRFSRLHPPERFMTPAERRRPDSPPPMTAPGQRPRGEGPPRHGEPPRPGGHQPPPGGGHRGGGGPPPRP